MAFIKKRLGEVLIENKIITEEQLKKALEIQKKLGMKLGEVLIKEKFTTEEQIILILETQFNIKKLNLYETSISPQVIKLIPESTCRKHTVIGVEIFNNELILAMSDPLNYFAIEDN